VEAQTSAKDKFYNAFYNRTLNPVCVAQRASKSLKKLWKIGPEARINT
jgi:hypothetical protein